MRIAKHFLKVGLLIILATFKVQASVQVQFTLTQSLYLKSDLRYVVLCGNALPLTTDPNTSTRFSITNDSQSTGTVFFHDSLRGKTISFYHFLVPNVGYAQKEVISHSVKIPASGNATISVKYNEPDVLADISSEHFLLYGPYIAKNTLQELADTLENNYKRISQGLFLELNYKIKVMVYKDISTYHIAMGYPNAADWVVGNAIDSTFIKMVSPDNAGPAHNKQSLLKVIVHEFTHNCVAATANGENVPIWLNEGTALYMARQRLLTQEAKSLYQQLGRIRSLNELEQDFAGNDGYKWGESILQYIVKRFGLERLVAFMQHPNDFSILRAANKSDFEDGWHQFVNEYYLSNPQPLTLPYVNGFDSSGLSNITTISQIGYQLWENANFGSPAPSATISGYDRVANDNEDWLITPLLDFTGHQHIGIAFNEAINHASNSEPINQHHQVLISTNYDGVGSPSAATWTELKMPNRSTGDNWTFVSTDTLLLDEYIGNKKVSIAFKYQSNTQTASTWEIDNINVFSVHIINVDHQVVEKLNVYPNPVFGNELRIGQIANYQILDLNGRIVKTVFNTNSIDVSCLEKGTYLVKNGNNQIQIFMRN